MELESSLRFVNDEKSRVTAESRQVEVDREKLRVDKEQLDQQKRLFQVVNSFLLIISHKSCMCILNRSSS